MGRLFESRKLEQIHRVDVIEKCRIETSSFFLNQIFHERFVK